MDSSSATTVREPRIIIVGGGFGGLAAARAVRKASARVLLIVGGDPTGVELAGAIAELARQVGIQTRRQHMTSNGFDYDVIVIGSGFGGNVAALRARFPAIRRYDRALIVCEVTP